MSNALKKKAQRHIMNVITTTGTMVRMGVIIFKTREIRKGAKRRIRTRCVAACEGAVTAAPS